jgi:hypothetical protein
MILAAARKRRHGGSSCHSEWWDNRVQPKIEFSLFFFNTARCRTQKRITNIEYCRALRQALFFPTPNPGRVRKQGDTLTYGGRQSLMPPLVRLCVEHCRGQSKRYELSKEKMLPAPVSHPSLRFVVNRRLRLMKIVRDRTWKAKR